MSTNGEPVTAGEHRRWPTTVALVLTGTGAVMFAATLSLSWSSRDVVLPAGFEPGHPPSLMLALLLFVGAGGLVASQRPANPVGWILLTIGLLWQLIGLAGVVRVTIFARSVGQ